MASIFCPRRKPPSKHKNGLLSLDGEEVGDLARPLLVDGSRSSGGRQQSDSSSSTKPRQGLEGRANIISRLTFWWTVPLLAKAFKEHKLELEDLPALEEGDQSGRVYQRFFDRWSRIRDGVNHHKSRGMKLAMCLHSTFWKEFWACGGVLLIASTTSLAIPLALNTLLSYIEDTEEHDRQPYTGFLLALGVFALVVLQSLAEHQFWIVGIRCVMRAQVSIM